MRAVVVDYESRRLEKRDVREPAITATNQALIQVHQAGVCGTDREIASFRIAFPPPGESYLTIGHEAVAQVLETGRDVKNVAPGDWVAPIVRRPCPACSACASGRADLCLSGKYRERGIVAAHGYFTELAVDDSRFLVRIPERILDFAVLLEPLSVVEKAVEAAQHAHSGLWASTPPKALVLGAGTVGILAALVLRERGFNTAVSSLENTGHPRVRLLEHAGIPYESRTADVVIEATGSPEAAVRGIECLARNGVLVVLGASNARVEFPFRDLILANQTVLGSVNAAPHAFERGLEDLERLDPAILKQMIHRVPFDRFKETITGPLTPHPKLVHMIL